MHLSSSLTTHQRKALQKTIVITSSFQFQNTRSLAHISKLPRRMASSQIKRFLRLCEEYRNVMDRTGSLTQKQFIQRHVALMWRKETSCLMVVLFKLEFQGFCIKRYVVSNPSANNAGVNKAKLTDYCQLFIYYLPCESKMSHFYKPIYCPYQSRYLHKL